MAPLRIVGNPSYPQAVHRRETAAGPIVECPPAVTKRLRPADAVRRRLGSADEPAAHGAAALDARARAGRVSVFWVHPWEIDDDPPVVRLPAANAFAHYFRLSGFADRLETILKGATFGPLGPVALGHAR